MAARLGLSHAVIRQVALFVDQAQEKRLTHRRCLVRPVEEFRQVEHRPLAQRPDPILARSLIRGASPRVDLKIDGAVAGFDDVTPRAEVSIDEVSDLEGVHPRVRRAEQLPDRHGPAPTANLEAPRLDEVHRFQEIQFEPAARLRPSEEPTVLKGPPLPAPVADYTALPALPRPRRLRRPGSAQPSR